MSQDLAAGILNLRRQCLLVITFCAGPILLAASDESPLFELRPSVHRFQPVIQSPAQTSHNGAEEIRFSVTGKPGTTGHWRLPIPSRIRSTYRIRFDVSAENISVSPGPALSARLKVGKAEPAAVAIYRPVGPLDQEIGEATINTDSSGVLSAIDVRFGPAAEGTATLTLRALTVGFSSNLPPAKEITALLAQSVDHKQRPKFLPTVGIPHLKTSGATQPLVVMGANVAPQLTPGTATTCRLQLHFGGRHPALPEPLWPHRHYVDFDRLQHLLKSVPETNAIQLHISLWPLPDWWQSNEAAGRLAGFQYCDVNPIWRRYCREVVRYVLYAARRGGVDARIWGIDFGLGPVDNTEPPLHRDHDDAYRHAFRVWLRQKYDDETALRAAWKDQEVTFDKAVPVPLDAWRGGTIGCLRHPLAELAARDSMAFYQYSWSSSLVYLAGLVHEIAHERYLAGVVGGPALYLNSMWNRRSRTDAAALRLVLESPRVDYLVMPVDRIDIRAGIGAAGAEMLLADTLRRHDKQLLVRHDLGTHRSVHPGYGATRRAADTVSVLRRTVATAMTHGAGVIFEPRHASDYDRDIVAEVETAIDINAVPRSPVRGPRDVAFVLDPDCHLGQAEVAVQAVERWRHLLKRLDESDPTEAHYADTVASLGFHLSGLPRMTWYRTGFAFDTVFIDDLEPESYRLLVFFNISRIDASRRAIVQRAQSDGRVLVWTWAAGAVSERYVAASNVTKNTGIWCQIRPQKMDLTSVFTRGFGDESPPLPRAETAASYRIHRQPSFQAPLRIELSDPDVRVVAHHPITQEATVVRKDYHHWTTVYSRSPYLPAHLLREVAAAVGVHVYTARGDICLISDSFVALHTHGAGNRQLSLPEEGPLFEVYRKQALPARKDHRLALKGERTYLFYRGSEASWKGR